MSRIQEILAKADRDGTARRLQPAASHGSPASQGSVMTSVVDGSSALDTSSFTPATDGVDSLKSIGDAGRDHLFRGCPPEHMGDSLRLPVRVGP